MGKLNFSKKNDGDYTILEIGGVIDTGVAPELESEMKAAISSGSKFIGDFSGLEHLTSAGLGVFIAIKDQIAASGGDIKLCNVSEKILKVFSLMHLDKLIQIVATIDDAKKSF